MKEKEMIIKGKRFKKMDCPVCNKFSFVEPTESDLEDPEYSIDDDYCFICGWNYDLDQTENPDLKNGNNEMSLNEYKEWYRLKIKENPNWEYLESVCPPPAPHECPICGKHEFKDKWCYEVCPQCGWEDDMAEEWGEDCLSGANGATINEYRDRYKKWLELYPKYNWSRMKDEQFDRLEKKGSKFRRCLVVTTRDKYFFKTDETIKEGTEGEVFDFHVDEEGNNVYSVIVHDYSLKNIVYEFFEEDIKNKEID